MSLFDFLFHKHEEPVEPADGYLAHPINRPSIVRPGRYAYAHREVRVLGFKEDGSLTATLFLHHRGSGECSEWGTLDFSKVSGYDQDEIWEAIVGRCGIVLHVTRHGGELKIKIEVDK